MKRIIFAIYDDIKKELDGPTEMEAKNIFNMDQANSLLMSEYFDKLVENKREYANSIGVEFKLFHNTMEDFVLENENDFTNVNLYKHHLFAKLAEEYDEVMYVDMDVVFNTDLNVFEEHDLSKGIHVKDQDSDILSKNKNEIVLSRVGKRAPTLKYFITKDLLDGQDNHVLNTGIMFGRSEHILQLKYIERTKEVSEKIQELKARPELLNIHYYANNESIFSYIVEKYKVPYVLLDEAWHKMYDDKPAEGLEGHCIHFINKQFGRFFKEKTKCLFSLHIDIPKELLDNPRSFKDNPLSKSEITKNQLNEYKDKLIDNHNSYANAIGATYIHYSEDKDYKTFRKRFTNLSEYDIVNLYKIWLLDQLTKEYDLVMYIDLDVYFRNHASIFDTIPCDYALCCLYDDKNRLGIKTTNDYFKSFKQDYRNPESKYWNTHALLIEDGLDGDNYVFNTGVVIASKRTMEQLDYFSDIDEVLENMKELKEDEFSMYPEAIQKSFGYDNETIFSYKAKKNDVIVYQLGEWWHSRNYYEGKESFKQGTQARKNSLSKYKTRCKDWQVTIVHFISKNFGLAFDDA